MIRLVAFQLFYLGLLAVLLVGCGGKTDGASRLPADLRLVDLGRAWDANMSAGEFRRAIHLGDSMIAICHSCPEGYFFLASTQEVLGRTAEAERGYREALRIDADFTPAVHNLAGLLVRANRFREGLDLYMSAAEATGAAAEWHGAGRAFLALGNADSAAWALAKATEADQEYAAAYAASTELAEARGDIQAALSYSETAAALEPEMIDYKCTYGRLLNATGQHDRSIEVLSKVTERARCRSEALHSLASALAASGRTNEADSIQLLFSRQAGLDGDIFRFEERVRLDPTGIRDRLELADRYERAGRYTEALSQLLVVRTMIEPNDAIEKNILVLRSAIAEPPS